MRGKELLGFPAAEKSSDTDTMHTFSMETIISGHCKYYSSSKSNRMWVGSKYCIGLSDSAEPLEPGIAGTLQCSIFFLAKVKLLFYRIILITQSVNNLISEQYVPHGSGF